MRTFVLTLLACAAVTALAGCGGWTYGGEDTFGKQGPNYGDRPAYFDAPQPGLGGHASDGQ